MKSIRKNKTKCQYIELIKEKAFLVSEKKNFYIINRIIVRFRLQIKIQ